MSLQHARLIIATFSLMPWTGPRQVLDGSGTSPGRIPDGSVERLDPKSKDSCMFSAPYQSPENALDESWTSPRWDRGRPRPQKMRTVSRFQHPNKVWNMPQTSPGRVLGRSWTSPQMAQSQKVWKIEGYQHPTRSLECTSNESQTNPGQVPMCTFAAP